MNTTSQQERTTGMRVAYAIADKPQASRVDGVRATGQCSNFWFLRSAGSRDLIPMPGAPEAQIAAFRPTRDADTATAATSTEIGELAAAITARMKAEAPPELVRDIDVIIVCTAGIDSPIGISMAGKVKHILGAAQAFPFAIGQMDGCQAFEAMRIARAFLHGPERARVVAVVASECWWYPYIRSFGDYAQYGDGAAAMLLCADDARAPGGDEIVDVVLARHETQQGPFDLAERPWYRDDAWPKAVGDFLAGFLQRQGLEAGALARIESPSLDPAFIDAVAKASGLPLTPGTGGFVSSVDPMLAIGHASTGDGATADGATGLVLTWSVGLNGEMGACLQRPGAAVDAAEGVVR